MRIGITGVNVDRQNKEVIDLIKFIKASGNQPVMIYADALDVSFGKSGIEIYQQFSRPSGAGIERRLIDVGAVLLRHLGIVRDYEQFAYRLWCMRAFEKKDIFVMNPLLSWLFASDKFAALLELAKHNLPVPETLVTEQLFSAYDALRRFKSSVIKPLRSAMGFGVFKVDDPDVGMHIFSYFTDINKPMYVQKYLEKLGGGDYRVIVVGGEVVGAEFRKGLTWKSNLAQGGTPRRAEVDSEMEELAVRATEVLSLEYAGVDIAKTKEGYFILETNPTLSWQGFKRVTGINPAKRIVQRLIEKSRG